MAVVDLPLVDVGDLLVQEWCKEKMKKLQGTDDLTLVRFLMSCSSNGEIVEYISAYLGKSTEVSQFTSEFIRRKFEEAAGKKVVVYLTSPNTLCDVMSAWKQPSSLVEALF